MHSLLSMLLLIVEGVAEALRGMKEGTNLQCDYNKVKQDGYSDSVYILTSGW